MIVSHRNGDMAMKITRNRLRNIIKEEITRLIESDNTLVFDDIDIVGDPNAAQSHVDRLGQETVDYWDKLNMAVDALDVNHLDAMSDLSDLVWDGKVNLEDAKEYAADIIDSLARLPNADEIGVEAAAAALGL